ncbi:DUF2087 domain-containing protein [Streptomyces justiciae]|uniref:DUF2087 domain-containing protein n=1 Tax=Streptomyces justiciae TaxID=2780140 RepID=A0ABU3M663_9ACTN|nr:DUF2087 domain-containing protein [Streptomyces justiciae]MDT7847004.1 DUF2087 domain-containing protein [Streptomyces justiciae]
MATDRLIRLFTDENRVRVFAAVALGAGTPEEVARAAGVPAKETALALLKLREQGVVRATAADADGAVTAADADGGETRLAVAYDLFRQYAREDREATRAAGNPASGDEDTDQLLRTFVRDGRLVRLPAQWTRKKRVLKHIAEQTFEPGVEYPERTVNEKLRAWCEDGDTDHVTLRRYLVDLQHLRRSEGVYRRVA